MVETVMGGELSIKPVDDAPDVVDAVITDDKKNGDNDNEHEDKIYRVSQVGCVVNTEDGHENITKGIEYIQSTVAVETVTDEFIFSA